MGRLWFARPRDWRGHSRTWPANFVVLGARLLSPLATVFVVLGASACWYLVPALCRRSIGTLHACFVVFGNVVFRIWKRRKTTSAMQLEIHKRLIARSK
jgi:hypothetical protein